MVSVRAGLLRRIGLFVLLLAGLLWLAPAQAQAPAVQQVPGTTVSMAPPAGLSLATEFSGFRDQDGTASILISELPPEAYPQISAVFGDLDSARQAFATRGVAVNAVKRIERPSGIVLLLTGTQTAGDLTIAKWIAVLKGEKTVLITFQAAAGSKLTDASVLSAIESIALSRVPTLAEKVAKLPFTIVAAPPFRIVDTLGGAAVILAAGDLDVDPEGKQPLIVAAVEMAGPAGGGSLAQIARALLGQTQNLKGAVVETEKAIRFAQADGVVLSGKTGDGRQFSQFLAIGPQNRWARLLAFVPPSRVDDTRAAIETIAQSITLKP